MKARALILFVVLYLTSGRDQSRGESPPLSVIFKTPPWEETSLAQEERERQAHVHAKWNVCVDFQMVDLEEAKALELIPDLLSDDRQKNTAAWERVQAMIKRKEATLVAWPMVRTTSGCSAVSESIVEERYPTEFEPPQEPTTGIRPEPAKPGPVDDKTMLDIPNAYETRNMGVTLEVQGPTVSADGRQVHLRLTVSRVELLDFEDYGLVLMPNNRLVTVTQPRFGNLKSDLSLTLQSGGRELIAIHKLTKPANLIELHFVRAVISPVE